MGENNIGERKMSGKCASCGKWLHASFPDDFPDEFKFCCICYDVLLFLSGIDTEYFNREEFSEHLGKCSICQGMVKMKREMLGLITVN